MSYSYRKPNLIEPKITKLITNKLEERKNKINLESQMKEIEITQKIIPDPFYKKVLKYLLNLLKKNYILIIIILLVIILLHVRYIETKKRKEQMKRLLEQFNEESF